MMIFEGIPYFCFPEQVKSFAQKIQKIPIGVMRTIGFCLMITGLLVTYLGGGE